MNQYQEPATVGIAAPCWPKEIIIEPGVIDHLVDAIERRQRQRQRQQQCCPICGRSLA